MAKIKENFTSDNLTVEEKLRTSEERYQAFIKNSSEGIWRFDLEKPISTNLPPDKQIKLMYKWSYLAEANDAIAKMYGVQSVKQLIGARLSDLLVASDPKNMEYLKAFINSGYKLSDAESHEKDTQGKDKYFSNSLVGIIKDGYLLHAWGTQQDITKQRETTQSLKKNQEILDLALKASSIGIWEWDILTERLYWSDQLRKIYGVKSNQNITYEYYLSLLHPNDIGPMQEVIQRAMKTGKSYQVEHRIIWADKSEHWVLGQGRAFLKNKQPVRMIGTAMNIDERRATEGLRVKMAALNIEQQKLLEINKAKDEFVAITSHQLRTPATGIKQYLGLLLEGYAEPLTEVQSSFVEKAYENNERQLHLIDQFLKIAQLDLDKVVLNYKKTNITKLIKQSLESLADIFKSQNQRARLENIKSEVFATVDSEQIRLVIENLLENASHYSPENTTIRIKVLKDEDENTLIEIKDEGVGIKKSDIPKLFQKFSRIRNPLSDSVSGTGLGLYFSKKIVELHKGTIKAVPASKKGTIFTIKLPAK